MTCDKEIEERCSAFMAKMEKRLAKIEKNLGDKPNIIQVEELIDRKIEERLQKIDIASNQNQQQEITKESVTRQIREWNDRGTRLNNIIIYKAPEDENTTDVHKVQDILGQLETNTTEIQIEKTIRLGKTTEEGTQANKIRPLKVVLKDKESKMKILKNANKLRLKEEPYKLMSMSQDMTKQERERDMELYLEAKNLNSKNEGGPDHKYRVRGPAWDRRLVKLKTTT